MLDNSQLLKHKDKIEKQTGKKLKIPELTSSYEVWVFDMFKYLHTQRIGGEPLKIADVLALMTIKRVEEYERGLLLDYIILLDHEYLSWDNKRRKKEERRNRRK